MSKYNNIIKTANATKVNSRYDLEVVELKECVQKIIDEPTISVLDNVLYAMFKYGYTKGQRATLKEIKSK